MRFPFSLFLALLGAFSAFAQSSIPTVRTREDFVWIRLNGEKGRFSKINETPNPFYFSITARKTGSAVQLISEQDSISILLYPEKTTVFRIVRQAKGDTLTCHFLGVPEAAIFSEAYQKANRGKTTVEIPEVYELLNVVFALTAQSRKDENLIYDKTPYYEEVQKHFAPWRQHPAVQRLDSMLAAGSYHSLKMDSYAFVFQGDKLVNGGIYDRISWEDKNTLSPSLPLLADFARTSGFRQFYRQHRPYYTSLTDEYRREIDVASMKKWLEAQFPRTRYDGIRVIFSPLVAYNQSANRFENNGYKEAQAHVNFPYKNPKSSATPKVQQAIRMVIIFTELNHNYLNPEAERYDKQIKEAFENLKFWTAGKASDHYQDPFTCFAEYMNYALVTLYFSDIFDAQTAENRRKATEENMVGNRGFSRFAEFDQELLRLYKTRQPGQTVADLFPAILEWAGKVRMNNE
ncbi:DUF4932 domain-containing protein [Tellurirhabdus rosea]|uniref:DUF4932 domain-containing protein n=1 Tax=Tellurirhabdus rosea TaxID=2674997 RepID=UPI00225B9BE1|nr:DUF4932 domain-containing protein [Tellurirhabdus rosea]